MTAPPLLSVIIVVGSRRDRLALCLDSVLAQDVPLEVLVADLSPDAGPLPHAEHPAVRPLPMPPGTLFGPARAAAVAEARADVVAFLEEHAAAEPGWAEALLDVHRGSWAGVGPAVVNANPGVGRSDVTGLLSYGLFAPPVAPGEATIIPGHNSSYKRVVLLGYSDALPVLLSADNAMMLRLRADGHRLAMAPGARIRHLNETRLGSVVRGYFWHHRTAGPLRARLGRWSRWRRAAYVVLAPLVPLYFLARTAPRLTRGRPGAARTLRRALPFVVTAQLAAALGQAAGLLLGPGRAPERFTVYECTEERAVAPRTP